MISLSGLSSRAGISGRGSGAPGSSPFLVGGGGAGGRRVAPAFHFGQKRVVPLCRTMLAFGGLGVFVERAFEHGFAGEHRRDFVPLLDIVLVAEIHHPRCRGTVALIGLAATVVNSELLEVGEGGER